MKFIILPLLFTLTAFANFNSIVISKTIATTQMETPKISINIDMLRDAKRFKTKQPITIAISEDKSFTFIPKRFNIGKDSSDFTWVGTSKDNKSKAILTVKNGVMVGTITSNGTKYKLYPENDYLKVIKIDNQRDIPFYHDTITEPKKIKLPLPQLKSSGMNKPKLFKNTKKSSEASETDSVITLLAYYTQALKDEYGDSTEAMIQSNIDLAKDAYIESDTEIDLQVAKIKLVPSDTLLSSADASDLNDLLDKLSTDGLVRYEREVYHADAVTVFSKYPDGDSCGLGFTPNDSESTFIRAFTAIHVKPASEGGSYCLDLTFAHELGHNFGCFHDADHSSGTPMYDYAYGYDIEDEFGTIMSYDGPSISYFSNPDKTYTNPDTENTNAIGDAAEADNARTIRENQLKVADNSEQISEALESDDNDTLVNYAVSGTLNNNADRDGYIMWLEGNTTFVTDNDTYSNNAFFLNIYNEKTHQWMDSFNDDEKSIVFKRGKYRVSVAFSNDETGNYYDVDTIGYTIDITTQYKANINPAIITYLLN